MPEKVAVADASMLPELIEFKSTRQSLVLATHDQHSLLNASYAPFVQSDDGLYILVTALATHGQNLQQLQSISAMLLEDESDAKHIFARKRITFDATVTTIARDSDTFSEVTALLKQRFGKLIDTLTGLGDFTLYKLTPQQGLYVKGFGQAFSLTKDDILAV